MKNALNKIGIAKASPKNCLVSKRYMTIDLYDKFCKA